MTLGKSLMTSVITMIQVKVIKMKANTNQNFLQVSNLKKTR